MSEPDPNLSPPRSKGGLTELIRRVGDTEIIRRARGYSPVILRGALWVGIAMLTDAQSSLKSLADKGSVSIMDWTDVGVRVALSGLVAWRIFLDQSMSRFHEDKGKTPPI